MHKFWIFDLFLLKWGNGRKFWTFFYDFAAEIHFILEYANVVFGRPIVSSNPIVLLSFHSSNDFSSFLSPPFVFTNFSFPFISIFYFDYNLVHNFMYKNPFGILTLAWILYYILYAFVSIVIIMLYTHKCTKTKQSDDRNFGIDPNLNRW